MIEDTPERIAWAAGLYEGEGCASYDSNGPAITVSIGMTDEEPIRLFHEIVKVGVVKGPFLRKGNRKQYWLWRVRSWDQAQEIYDAFKPWLCPRRCLQFEFAFLFRPERPLSVSPCGRCNPDIPSTSGYQRHKRYGEPVCADAWTANRAYRKLHG